MSGPFMNVRFHSKQAEGETRGPALESLGVRGARPREPGKAFDDDEAAARYYLESHFARDQRTEVRGLIAPESPAVVPDLAFRGVQEMPGTRTRLVQFEQTLKTVPIFGTNAVVELGSGRKLVSLDAEVVGLADLSAFPTIDQTRALKEIAAQTGSDPDSLRVEEPASLVFFHDDRANEWHLAFQFRNIPVAPLEPSIEGVPPEPSHGVGTSLGRAFPRYDYIVDAHNGKILLAFSAVPTFIPTRLQGVDELGDVQRFWGREDRGAFLLDDPVRKIKTYDLGLGASAGSPLPTVPISSSRSNLGKGSTAAVSAHANATKVYKFFKEVLNRDGIDGKGMELISVINCTDPKANGKSNDWSNAEWHQGRMWYGQSSVKGGRRSWASYLDIIAHELTHGVTETSCKLVYSGQSGSLNESFSDIFGAIISNWYGTNKDNPDKWVWEIGRELGEPDSTGERGPLRSMSDPSKLEFFKKTEATKHINNRYPARYQDYVDPSKYGWGDWDSGGVHVNSGIHNKAAYHFLTAKDGDGGPLAFTPEDVAVLYYHCLLRLNALADFAKARDTVIDVARTYFAGDDTLEAKLKLIRDAYQQVGL